jgi:hypothetical protein
MKQSFASATGFRGGGPILVDGAKARVRRGVPPPQIVLGMDHPIVSRCRNSWACFLIWRSCRGAKHHALRNLAGMNKTPQPNEQLTRERDDHLLLTSTGRLDALSEPDR